MVEYEGHGEYEGCEYEGHSLEFSFKFSASGAPVELQTGTANPAADGFMGTCPDGYDTCLLSKQGTPNMDFGFPFVLAFVFPFGFPFGARSTGPQDSTHTWTSRENGTCRGRRGRQKRRRRAAGRRPPGGGGATSGPPGSEAELLHSLVAPSHPLNFLSLFIFMFISIIFILAF